MERYYLVETRLKLGETKSKRIPLVDLGEFEDRDQAMDYVLDTPVAVRGMELYLAAMGLIQDDLGGVYGIRTAEDVPVLDFCQRNGIPFRFEGEEVDVKKALLSDSYNLELADHKLELVQREDDEYVYTDYLLDGNLVKEADAAQQLRPPSA